MADTLKETSQILFIFNNTNKIMPAIIKIYGKNHFNNHVKIQKKAINFAKSALKYLTLTKIRVHNRHL